MSARPTGARAVLWQRGIERAAKTGAGEGSQSIDRLACEPFGYQIFHALVSDRYFIVGVRDAIHFVDIFLARFPQ